MLRMLRNLGMAAALLLLPVSASALGISITNVSSTGASTTLLQVGDIITFDLVLENNGGAELYALGVGVGGYDTDQNGLADNGLAFVSGDVAQRAFNQVPGFGGLDNIRYDGIAGTGVDGAVQQGFNNPFNYFLGLPTIDPLRVSLFDGITLSPTNGDGSNDFGLGGSLIDAQGQVDVHFRVSFQAIAGLGAPESRTLTFGDDVQGFAAVGNGGVLFDFTDATHTFTVVPEPGTALLMGLGLVGLATGRRR